MRAVNTNRPRGPECTLRSTRRSAPLPFDIDAELVQDALVTPAYVGPPLQPDAPLQPQEMNAQAHAVLLDVRPPKAFFREAELAMQPDDGVIALDDFAVQLFQAKPVKDEIQQRQLQRRAEPAALGFRQIESPIGLAMAPVQLADADHADGPDAVVDNGKGDAAFVMLQPVEPV